ncbi:MAG: shikimate dehydrogenase [Firmicutes bacterium HGW-Firmicutes-2]|jgi:shikimate dehydrogenase|nr:MAG: shikimate dehydrogenase [Firmicutes bacterium HGW-Firmicutes-2]
MINGTTDIYGLIGDPVGHSFSPFIHNMLAEALNENMAYVAFHVKENQLEHAMNGLTGLSIKGVNVTVPYKVDVMSYLDQVDNMARAIGAVNTIVLKNNERVGYNTDWIGLSRALKEIKVDLKDRSILIIGAGGAARAVGMMCAHEGAGHIAITNRTQSNADQLAKLIGHHYDVSTEVIPLEDLKERNDLVIAFQTTPIGMYPHSANNPIYETKFYETLEVAVDLIYNPQETHFLREAREAGAITMNGMGMLFHQAIAAFELWRDCTIDDGTKKRCYQAFLQQMTK